MIIAVNANALHIPLADQSVQCIVTSPPYYGLRDYGVSNQIGLEATPAAYVASIVAVMRECWRVLKDDGVLWLNLGDSYAGGNQTGRNDNGRPEKDRGWAEYDIQRTKLKRDDGLKPKDLCGIPWRVAFALQDAGWYLRQDIIWHKPNPMPESVTDRCTKAHEYIFLLTKQARYFYDAEAIAEEASNDSGFAKQRANGFDTWSYGRAAGGTGIDNHNGIGGTFGDGATRNRRSVWTVATSPYSGAHFATFPPALIEPMILAGTSQRGECPHCGKAWVRVVELGEVQTTGGGDGREVSGSCLVGNRGDSNVGKMYQHEHITTGWRQQCDCPPHEPIPQTVLDPFAGSGTTGAVAVKHGRRAVLLDLNTKYIDLQFERTNGVQMTMPV